MLEITYIYIYIYNYIYDYIYILINIFWFNFHPAIVSMTSTAFQEMDFATWQRLNRGIETNGTNVPDHVQQQVYTLVNKATATATVMPGNAPWNDGYKSYIPWYHHDIRDRGCPTWWQFVILFLIRHVINYGIQGAITLFYDKTKDSSWRYTCHTTVLGVLGELAAFEPTEGKGQAHFWSCCTVVNPFSWKTSGNIDPAQPQGPKELRIEFPDHGCSSSILHDWRPSFQSLQLHRRREKVKGWALGDSQIEDQPWVLSLLWTL